MSSVEDPSLIVVGIDVSSIEFIELVVGMSPTLVLVVDVNKVD